MNPPATFAAQRGWPAWQVGFASAFALAAVAIFLKWGLDTGPAWLLLGLAVLNLGTAGYDRSWSLRLDADGISVGRLGGSKRVPWSDVAFVRVEPSGASGGSLVVQVGARPGTRSPELRFQVERLSPEDRKRLGREFAGRGFPLGLQEA